MTIAGLETTTELVQLPEPHGLTWTTEYLRPDYEPLASWFELDLLIMRVGQDGFPYLVVVDDARRRFAQCMGDAEGMIIEVCDTAGAWRPLVWRLRRHPSGRLPHAAMNAELFDGDGEVVGDHLFTASEAIVVFREWLRCGTAGELRFDEVPY